MMRAPLTRVSRRGVTLIEGLMSTMILLIGMVGVLQGLAVASVQNSMANRHTRASIIAQQLISAIEQQGRTRLFADLFSATNCVSTIPTAVADFQGDLVSSPASFTAAAPGLGWTGVTTCFIDFDSRSAALRSLTPGYTQQDDDTYQRLIAVYQRSPTNPEVVYVGVNVGWRDGGRVRIVKRFTAIYDTSTNQTNLEF